MDRSSDSKRLIYRESTKRQEHLTTGSSSGSSSDDEHPLEKRDSESVKSEISEISTASSIHAFYAEKGNVENFSTKYVFSTDETKDDEDEPMKGIRFVVKHNSSGKLMESGDSALLNTAIISAENSSSGLELMTTIIENLSQLIITIPDKPAILSSTSREEVSLKSKLNDLLNEYREKCGSLTSLRSISQEIGLIPQRDSTSDYYDLPMMINNEVLIESSKIFENFRVLINDELKIVNRFKSQAEEVETKGKSEVSQEILFPGNNPEEDEMAKKDILIKESALLARCLAIAAEKKDPLLKDYTKTKTIPGPKSRYCDELLKLEADNLTLRNSFKDLTLPPETTEEKIQGIREIKEIYAMNDYVVGSSYKNLKTRYGCEDTDSLFNAIIGKKKSSSTVDSETKRYIEYIEDLAIKKGRTLPNQKTKYVTYELDDDLSSKYSARTDRRPDTAFGSHQADHVTAYVALVMCFVNAIPPIARARNLPKMVENKFNIALGKEGIESSGYETCDDRRRDFIKSFESLEEGKLDAINRLIKTNDLRKINSHICYIANNFLETINSEEYASFFRSEEISGGYTKGKDEGEAIDYITKLVEKYRDEAILSELENQISELKSREEAEKKSEKIDNLEKFKSRVEEKIEKTIIEEKRTEEVGIKESSTEIGEGVIEEFSSNFCKIFDLKYASFEKHEEFQYIDDEFKPATMRRVATSLIERHFRIFGTFASEAIEGLEKSLNQNIAKKLSRDFIDNFVKQESFSKLLFEFEPVSEEDKNKRKEEFIDELEKILHNSVERSKIAYLDVRNFMASPPKRKTVEDTVEESAKSEVTAQLFLDITAGEKKPSPDVSGEKNAEKTGKKESTQDITPP
ncbi:MAG: hypothetical protein KGQ36_00295 [Rickettsiales bacterium]|nr:hypothetical protein [Rickettsiales bacterium]